MLTAVDRQVLELEKNWKRGDGTKTSVIREKLGMSGTQYYQILNRLLGNRDAIEAEPQLIGRLVRAREERRIHFRLHQQG